jgi:hypothetical protein
MVRHRGISFWIACVAWVGCGSEPEIEVEEASTQCILRDAVAGSPGGGRTLFELCNNGVDDDGDARVDEDCVCVIGAEQPCHSSAEVAGVGACGWGVQRCEVGAGVGVWGACEGAIGAHEETCDGLDDDCDGHVDEHCACERGTTQRCFPGALEAWGVGSCVDAEQRCDVLDVERSIDGVEAFTWSACVGASMPRAEACDGTDEDCDGVIDDLVEICNREDDDCDGEIDEGDVCAALPATFRLTRFGSSGGGGILRPETPLYDPVPTSATVVGPLGCSRDEVVVEEPYGSFECAPWPPTCPAGQHAIWAESTWICVPCEVVVQFGALFASERTCAPRPDLSCPAGEVPTYEAETREWRCRPECQDTTYDRAWLDGELVCVPC